MNKQEEVFWNARHYLYEASNMNAVSHPTDRAEFWRKVSDYAANEARDQEELNKERGVPER